MRYVQRMAGRCTPFGLFAGCSVAIIADRTNLELDDARVYERHSRLDNDYVFALTNEICRNEAFQSKAVYRPNSSLYFLNARWRYISTSFAGLRRRDVLTAIDADDVLARLIEHAAEGATLRELRDLLIGWDDDGSITPEDASQYLDALVNEQILVPELNPVVTGPEPLDEAIATLQRMDIPALAPLVKAMAVTSRMLADLDKDPLGLPLSRYGEIANHVATMGVTVDPSRLFQVDLRKPASSATCGPEIIDEVLRTISALKAMNPDPRPEPLRRFREAFRQRYDQREVPLLEALDEESGIGFEPSSSALAENAPLLDGLVFAADADPGSLRWTARDTQLMQLIDALKPDAGWRRLPLILTDKDVSALSVQQEVPLPDALSAVASVSVPDAPSSDWQLIFRHASGPSGINMVGRFCHADPQLLDWTRQQTRLEESFLPDACFAEIVHLPTGRLGNILARPLLRSYEIEYLGRSGAPATQRIAVTDLLVSVRDDRIVLRSKRLGREVIPRLSNMHNFKRGHGIYRFLCSLQYQGVAPFLTWRWGALENLRFLPRVIYGRTILSRARWSVPAAQIGQLMSAVRANSTHDIERWRSELGMPRFVAFVEADNELPVDFRNFLSVETFAHEAKDRPVVTVSEMLPLPEDLGAHDADGARFAHEIVVPFVRIQNQAVGAAAGVAKPAPSIKRSFAPGSQWLYLKCYGGTSTVDHLLTTAVSEVVVRQMAANAIDRWFFVRYGDPDWHLRIRLHGDLNVINDHTYRDATATLSGIGIWRVQLDTYEREIERYGGDLGIILSEELFWRDSEAVVDILRALPGDRGMNSRWRLCLLSADLMLSEFGFNVAEKQQIVRSSHKYLAKRIGGNKALHIGLGNKFRAERKLLDALINHDAPDASPMQDGIRALRRRSEFIEPLSANLRNLWTSGKLSIPPSGLVGSYIHMHTNRILRSSHAHQEFVVYEFLDRLYDGQIARARGRGARSGFAN